MHYFPNTPKAEEKEKNMGKFDDFDLDLKKSQETGIEPNGASATITTIVVGSVLTGCSADCLTAKCSDGCPMPTKDRPAASCHKNMRGIVQPRC